MNEHAQWALDQFGDAQVGDKRRLTRLVGMATRAAESPAGKISEVFSSEREREGAYDLLESARVTPGALSAVLGRATGLLAAGSEFAFVPVDGTSLTLIDRAGNKGFGSIGSYGSRGLKVISALGVSPAGVTLGLFSQIWWARTQNRSASQKLKKQRNRQRPAEQKETGRWLDAIDEAAARADETEARLWFQLDREADNQAVLLKLCESGQHFTVRASSDRRVESHDGSSSRLRQCLARSPSRGSYTVDVPAGPNRTARRADVNVTWKTVVLKIRSAGNSEQLLELTAVWALERNTCPPGEKCLDWLLLTSMPVRSLETAQLVIFGYTQRWRIEDFHRTWKRGACKVEETQLRSQQAVTVWAMILAAVAARIERLKLLARTEPDQPASAELTRYEIQALILLKRNIKKRNEVIPDEVPSIGQAVLWIAQIGGYMRQSSGAPPGSTTISRGFDRLQIAAQVFQSLENRERSNQC
jgi:DDE family transposase/transposase-like protein